MKTVRGSSLVEMMVALFVLAIGLLGIISMQVKAMKFSQTAYYYGQAIYLANDIAESIRGNADIADTYLIGLNEATPTASVNCETSSTPCTPTQLRAWNISQWRSQVERTLVGGKSAIENTGDFIRITVQFDDSRANDSGTAGQDLNEYVLVTEIN